MVETYCDLRRFSVCGELDLVEIGDLIAGLPEVRGERLLHGWAVAGTEQGAVGGDDVDKDGVIFRQRGETLPAE